MVVPNITESNTPQDYADIRLILGEQRSGKSTIGVGFAKDDYYDQLNGIMSPSGNIIKAQSLTSDDKHLLREQGIINEPFKLVKIFSDDGKHNKIIRIPPNYLVLSSVKIFANFHIFGMKASYISLADIIQYINTPLMTNCWILSDESVMTDARNSMTGAGIIAATLGAQIGKRNIHMCLMSQYLEMVERRYRLFKTMTVQCSYDPDTRYIECDIKRRNEPAFSVSVFAPLYWMNFDTNELIKVPEKKVARAYSSVT